MTQTEKLTRILFVANILHILTFLIIPFKPELLFESSGGGGMNLFGGILYLLAILSFAHWIYCLWFLSKFDRYSGNLIWLILFNAMYAPIYYYQVIINKRPLQNENLPPKELEAKEIQNIIEENDFAELMRHGITEVLSVWSNKEKQIELQESNSAINLTEELFTQWNDYRIKEGNFLNETFELEERIAIKQFDKVLNEKKNNFVEKYPEFKEFLISEEWVVINNLAKETLMKIRNTVGNIV